MSNDTESLLRDAVDASVLAHRLRLLRIESEHRLALYRARSTPIDPPRARRIPTCPLPAVRRPRSMRVAPRPCRPPRVR